jgi:hypothetical protein
MMMFFGNEKGGEEGKINDEKRMKWKSVFNFEGIFSWHKRASR